MITNRSKISFLTGKCPSMINLFQCNGDNIPMLHVATD